ncbi:MAG: hypothetical protein GXO77_12620 [Calditrichaeota bacterium]|nr:hypothetical protein [Calditrichota bacterium]
MGKKKNKTKSAKKRKNKKPRSKSKNREKSRFESGEILFSPSIEELIPQIVDSEMLPEDDDLTDFLEKIVFSSFLIDEPELQGVFFDPDLTLEEFLDVVTENDFDIDELYVLFEEGNEEKLWTFVQITANRLPFNRIKDAILVRLEDLGLRAMRDDNSELAVAASILGNIIDRIESKEALASIGLIKGLVMRSLLIGLEFARLRCELEEREGADVFSLQNGEKISDFNLDERFAELERIYPGLMNYLDNRAQEEGIWDEGMEALNKGELTLNLFTDKEISYAVEIFLTAIDKFREALQDNKESSEKVAKIFFELKTEAEEKVEEFVGRIINKKRLQKMIKRLSAYMDDPDYGEWFDFLLMLKEYLTQRKPEDINQLSFELFMTEVSQAMENKDLPIFKDRSIDLSYLDNN